MHLECLECLEFEGSILFLNKNNIQVSNTEQDYEKMSRKRKFFKLYPGIGVKTDLGLSFWEYDIDRNEFVEGQSLFILAERFLSVSSKCFLAINASEIFVWKLKAPHEEKAEVKEFDLSRRPEVRSELKSGEGVSQKRGEKLEWVPVQRIVNAGGCELMTNGKVLIRFRSGNLHGVQILREVKEGLRSVLLFTHSYLTSDHLVFLDGGKFGCVLDDIYNGRAVKKLAVWNTETASGEAISHVSYFFPKTNLIFGFEGKVLVGEGNYVTLTHLPSLDIDVVFSTLNFLYPQLKRIQVGKNSLIVESGLDVYYLTSRAGKISRTTLPRSKNYSVTFLTQRLAIRRGPNTLYLFDLFSGRPKRILSRSSKEAFAFHVSERQLQKGVEILLEFCSLAKDILRVVAGFCVYV